MKKLPLMTIGKIQYKSVKARKEFIMDCVFVGVALSVLYVGLYEKVSGDVIELHRNKERKRLAKIKEAYVFLGEKQKELWSRLSHKDLCTIKHKTTESGVAFINNIGLSDEDLNLQHLAVAILDRGLERERTTTFHPILEVFRDYNIVVEKVLDVVEGGGILLNKEIEVAELFVANVRY